MICYNERVKIVYQLPIQGLLIQTTFMVNSVKRLLKTAMDSIVNSKLLLLNDDTGLRHWKLKVAINVLFLKKSCYAYFVRESDKYLFLVYLDKFIS